MAETYCFLFRNCDALKQALVDYCTDYFQISINFKKLPDLPFFIGALIFPEEIKTMVNGILAKSPEESENITKILNLVKRMQEILYRFTNQKLQLYLNIPELSFLIKYYIRQDLDPV